MTTVLAGSALDHCDWIYINAHHDYGFVRCEIANARDKEKVGGFLVFNDYPQWSPANMMNYSVFCAVNKLVNEISGRVVGYFALQGANYYDIALRRLA